MATDFGALRYTTNQHPNSEMNNQIKTYYPVTGGRKGGSLEALAVPAALLIANNTLKRDSYTYSNYKRKGGSMEALAVPAALLIANNTLKRKGYTYPNYKSKRSKRRRSNHRRSNRRRSNRR